MPPNNPVSTAVRWVAGRAQHRSMHGPRSISRQRLVAILMIASGLLRVVIWATLIVLYLVGLSGIKHLYASVSFVAILSVVALLLTDWGQVAASLAQLTAGDAHHDAEALRSSAAIDVQVIEADIARLAQLSPGPDGDQLAAQIMSRIGSK